MQYKERHTYTIKICLTDACLERVQRIINDLSAMEWDEKTAIECMANLGFEYELQRIEKYLGRQSINVGKILEFIRSY